MFKFETDAAIERIALGVIDRTLPKADWTHAAHFAAAVWLLRYRRDLTTASAIKGLIVAYNEATGTPNTDTGGYHHTITLASMRAASAHLGAYPETASLHCIANELMASPLGHPDWLLAYWRRETLFSIPARHEWTAPDLAPLPF
ncbi:hypothetical protein OGR47_08250 [Methylocystis sp. MJC1]|jgi:hypothetical protein|uniref:hypothetical protein n=1 Tax=Methylocystis sp. MJC1 TaxID=2654282 RepID=UPI0013EB95E7|nr:hypothetical protein [Methylocystis sp. MJC1]KAF2989252.1 hypothetical protein MJC1_03725 [Methylocystis sp. MJC1]MBU6526975.1 hypothetical protein [Methylocystis sp. MJC1]UZX13413.1 hypothetical protein OGR47_08250 [Methylocystis sp. MJC1]